MIGLIQRLLQLAVIGILVWAICKPASMPVVAQPAAFSVSRFMVGSTVSWESFVSTWKSRWQWVVTYVPPLARFAQAVPSEPPALTIDSLMEVAGNVFLTQPAKKWNDIKSNLTAPPASSSSSTGQ